MKILLFFSLVKKVGVFSLPVTYIHYTNGVDAIIDREQ